MIAINIYMKALLFILTVLAFIGIVVYQKYNSAEALGHRPNSLKSASNTDHPNIVLILTDDLDTKSLAYMPNLQSLIADQGATFTRFYVNVPSCCPSRASILRGQYAHNTEILTNSPPFGGFEKFYQYGEESSTIATWIQAIGYRTALMGKYLNGYPNGAAENYIPPGWTEWVSPLDVRGSQLYASYNYQMNENGTIVNYGDSEEDYMTDVLHKKAERFIEESTKNHQAFFLYLAPFAPHQPAIPPKRHAKKFPNLQLPQGPSFNEEDVSDKPQFVQNKERLSKKDIDFLTEEYRERARALQAVDDMIVSLVTTLQEAGQLNNTYIFFTSDNGFHMGEHRLPFGKLSGYEEDILVPLLVRGPGITPGIVIEELTGNIDLAPTFGEIAKTKVPEFVDGVSLLPLLKGEKVPNWRKAYLIERGVMHAKKDKKNVLLSKLGDIKKEASYFFYSLYSQDKLRSVVLIDKEREQRIPPYRGIRTKNYFYVVYETGEKELYDLSKDPYQLQNIYASASSDLIKKLSDMLKILRSCTAASCRK